MDKRRRFEKFPNYAAEAQKFKDGNLIDSIEQDDQARHDNWYKTLNESDKGVNEHWKAADFDFSDWEQMQIPGFWADTPLGEKMVPFGLKTGGSPRKMAK